MCNLKPRQLWLWKRVFYAGAKLWKYETILKSKVWEESGMGKEEFTPSQKRKRLCIWGQVTNFMQEFLLVWLHSSDYFYFCDSHSHKSHGTNHMQFSLLLAVKIKNATKKTESSMSFEQIQLVLRIGQLKTRPRRSPHTPKVFELQLGSSAIQTTLVHIKGYR